MSSFYPILVDLQGKKALVVGGGKVAQRKIENLLDYGASVHVVARELTGELEHLHCERRIQFLGPEFSESYLEGAFLVIAATDDASLNRRVSQEAQKRGQLINAVDQPADCNFIVPSVLSRGDLLIAVSTSGKSPAFARKVRVELEQHFGEEYGFFLTLMGNLRERRSCLWAFLRKKIKELLKNWCTPISSRPSKRKTGILLLRSSRGPWGGLSRKIRFSIFSRQNDLWLFSCMGLHWS